MERADRDKGEHNLENIWDDLRHMQASAMVTMGMIGSVSGLASGLLGIGTQLNGLIYIYIYIYVLFLEEEEERLQ